MMKKYDKKKVKQTDGWTCADIRLECEWTEGQKDTGQNKKSLHVCHASYQVTQKLVKVILPCLSGASVSASSSGLWTDLSHLPGSQYSSPW